MSGAKESLPRMNRYSHTPGPWTIHPMRAVVIPLAHFGRPLGMHEDKNIDRERYAQEICAMHWPDRNRTEAEVTANARLIAAAPDLLATVRAIRDAIANCGDQPICAWAGALNAAIAKAEGRHA